MKLWQKIFLYTMILVMLAVSITSILLLKNSFSLAMEQRKQSVYSEHEFLLTSFRSLMLTERLRANAVVLDEEALRSNMADTFGDSKSGIAFFDRDNKQVYANKRMRIPKALIDAVKTSSIPHMQVQNHRLYTASVESIEGKNYYVITENDIKDVMGTYEYMLHQIQVISMSCAMGMSLILIVVVKLLLMPLKRVNEGTREIAQGNYHKRIRERGNDELSELARNMNIMAEAVERNVRALEDVAEDRKHFIDNLSHEMKTPLTSILGFSDLLQIKKEISDESRIEYAGIIKEEATRMRALSGKLMELITVGEAKLDWKQEDMAELFAEIGASLKVIADKHHLHFSCEAEAGMLWVDRELFKSLLYNLVDNAVKASSEGGSICVLGQFEDGQFCIEVADEGVGIPREEIDKITQAFYMVDKVRSRASGGAGLGLALCLEIVSAHRGVMRFESEAQQGTHVLIRMKGGKASA